MGKERVKEKRNGSVKIMEGKKARKPTRFR